ncbi:hypothetical protein D3C80_1912490 [compost metagenome]
MYSSIWKARKVRPSRMVSASQALSGPRLLFFSAWWAKVTVKLELTSKMVLISGRCQGSITALGGGNSLESGLLSAGQLYWKPSQSMLATPLSPSPPSQGPAKLRT